MNISPTEDQYKSTVETLSQPSGKDSSIEGALPFTGYDMTAIIVVAAAFVALGLYLRHRVAL